MSAGRIAALAGLLVGALVFVSTASAKIWFGSIAGKTYATGAAITTEINGCPVPCPVAGARIYLAAGARAGRTVAPQPQTLLGTVDRTGAVRFRAPAVRPGPYHLVARSRGNWLAASDAFRIPRPR